MSNSQIEIAARLVTSAPRISDALLRSAVNSGAVTRSDAMEQLGEDLRRTLRDWALTMPTDFDIDAASDLGDIVADEIEALRFDRSSGASIAEAAESVRNQELHQYGNVTHFEVEAILNVVLGSGSKIETGGFYG
jgi:hypothetical protein